jgi:TolA-binding protein
MIDEMKKRNISLIAATAGFVLAVSGPVMRAQDAAADQLARRQYKSGLSFLDEGKIRDALKDFQAVVDSFPQSSVAGPALLKIAECQLKEGEIEKAQQAVDKLQKTYSGSEAGPMGLVLEGRITLAKSRAAADVESAINTYLRVSRLYPSSEAVPASIYYAGEAYRLSHRDDEAIQSYRQVSTDYPDSEWARRAMLGEARCLVITGKPTRGMELLQRVRQRFPGTPESATAVAWNTILYRLYLRAPAQQAAFQFVAQKSIAGASGRLRDIKTMAISPAGLLYVATADGVSALDPSGKVLPGPTAKDARAILFDRSQQPVLICKESVVSQQIAGRPLSVKKQDGTLRYLNEVTTGVLTSGGDLLVADSSAKNVARFSPDGKLLGPPFSPAFPERLAIDVTDRVASLDQDGSGVTLIDHDGKARPKILQRGSNWQFDRPVDIAFDPLGHVYVLDRNAATVWVFAQGPPPKLLTSFTIPQKSPGVFRKAVCFALDFAGRLYIYDEDVEKIQVYQ